MKIFVDENIPLMTVQALREMGHDVLDIRGTPNEGMTNEAERDDIFACLDYAALLAEEQVTPIEVLAKVI